MKTWTGAEVLYFAMAGTFCMAITGIKNKIAAIIGAPIVSIISRMLGLIIATIQVVMTIKIKEPFSTTLTGALERDLIKPTRPS